MSPWLSSWIDPSLRGGIPTGEARDIAFEFGLEIEEAHLSDTPPSGCNFDTIECYDTHVRGIVFGASVDLGAHCGFLDALDRLYKGLHRTFAYGKAIGPWWVATTGFLQGCSLSRIWLNVSTTM